MWKKNLHDPKIVALAERIFTNTDEEMQSCFPETLGARVTIKFKDGSVEEELLIDCRGSPGNPMTTDELEMKARNITRMSMSAEKFESIEAEIFKRHALARRSISQSVPHRTKKTPRSKIFGRRRRARHRSFTRSLGLPVAGLLAHGYQVLAQTAPGASDMSRGDTEIRILGMLETSAKFLKGVYLGDTLYPTLEIVELIEQNTTGVMVLRERT